MGYCQGGKSEKIPCTQHPFFPRNSFSKALLCTDLRRSLYFALIM